MTIPELQEIEQRYIDATQTSQANEITALLTQLSIHFWQPDRPKGHWRAIISDFIKHLTPYPIDIIAKACELWHDPEHGSPFFPKPIEIKAIIMPLNAKRLRDLQDIRAFLRQRLQATEERAPPTPEDVSEVEEMLNRARANLGPPAATPGMRPIGQAATDVLRGHTDPPELLDKQLQSDTASETNQLKE